MKILGKLKQYIAFAGDVRADPFKVTKVILCSGKHYYNLDADRIKQNIDNVAIIRVESLVPFPIHEIQEEVKKYSNARSKWNFCQMTLRWLLLCLFTHKLTISFKFYPQNSSGVKRNLETLEHGAL